MSVMKKIFFVLALLAIVNVGANAAITTAEQTEAENLINAGFSESFAEDVLIEKNRALAEPCEPLYEQKHNKFVRFVLNVYSYIDPSQENSNKYHHNTKMYPSYTDL